MLAAQHRFSVTTLQQAPAHKCAQHAPAHGASARGPQRPRRWLGPGRRSRRSLLHREEINKLIGKVKKKGYALVPIDLHFLKGRMQLEIGLAKGQKDHDERGVLKEPEGQRDAAQATMKAVRGKGDE